MLAFFPKAYQLLTASSMVLLMTACFADLERNDNDKEVSFSASDLGDSISISYPPSDEELLINRHLYERLKSDPVLLEFKHIETCNDACRIRLEGSLIDATLRTIEMSRVDRHDLHLHFNATKAIAAILREHLGSTWAFVLASTVGLLKEVVHDDLMGRGTPDYSLRGDMGFNLIGALVGAFGSLRDTSNRIPLLEYNPSRGTVTLNILRLYH